MKGKQHANVPYEKRGKKKLSSEVSHTRCFRFVVITCYREQQNAERNARNMKSITSYITQRVLQSIKNTDT